MLHKGQESSSRRLVWVEGQSFAGWGCSECTWFYSISDPSTGKSLDEMKLYFQVQLFEEFASHACAQHPRIKKSKLAS